MLVFVSELKLSVGSMRGNLPKSFDESRIIFVGVVGSENRGTCCLCDYVSAPAMEVDCRSFDIDFIKRFC